MKFKDEFNRPTRTDPGASPPLSMIEYNTLIPVHLAKYLAKIETNYTQPDEKELELIYTTVVEDGSKCFSINQWTTWNSVRSPERNGGDDYETLQDHILHSSFS